MGFMGQLGSLMGQMEQMDQPMGIQQQRPPMNQPLGSFGMNKPIENQFNMMSQQQGGQMGSNVGHMTAQMGNLSMQPNKKNHQNLEVTVNMAKEVQTQPNVSAIPETMPGSPIPSFIITPATLEAGCHVSENCESPLS